MYSVTITVTTEIENENVLNAHARIAYYLS